MSYINSFVTLNETTIRLCIFVGVLVFIALWELLSPRKLLTANKPLRWANNLLLIAINGFILKVLLPVTSVGVAVYAHHQGWGLFNYYETPPAIVLLLSVIIMDLMIYFQHVLFHAVPVLWRLHRVHHADPDIDVTTGARFHPIEIVLSMLIKFAVIIILGAPALAVIIFEIILNAAAMFNHGNIRLPAKLDKWLRLIIVTPDMHRVHHSVKPAEYNQNFGFNLPWWDRLFNTYTDQPEDGHQKMQIGLTEPRDEKQVTWISGILTLPFKNSFTENGNNP